MTEKLLKQMRATVKHFIHRYCSPPTPHSTEISPGTSVSTSLDSSSFFLLFHFGFLLLLLCSLVVCSWFSIFFVAVGILVGENGGHTTNTQHTEEYSVGDCIAEYMATVEKEKIAFYPSSAQWRGWGSGR